MNLATLDVVVTASTSDYKSGMASVGTIAAATEKGVSGRMSSLGRKIGTGLKIGAIAGVAALGTVGAAGINAASDLEESKNKVAVVFGAQKQIISDYAASAATDLGMTEQQALEATGTFGNLFSAMKIGQGPSADMSKGLTTLAADLASFNNANPEDVLLALRSGLVGEVEPLRKFGVSLSAARVEEEAMRLGLVKQGQELSAAAKSQAAYSIIMKDTVKAQGDFARTSDGVANGMRIVKATIGDAMAKVGASLLPVVQKILPKLGDTVVAIVDAIGPGVTVLVDALAGQLGPVIESIAPVIGTLGETLGKVLAVLGPIIAKLVAGLAPILQTLIGALGEFLLALMPLLDPIAELLLAVAPLVPVLVELLTTAITPLVKILTPLISLIARVVAAVVDWIVQSPIARKVIGALMGPIVLIGQAISKFGETWSKVWGAIKGPVQAAWTWLKGIVGGIVDIFTKGWDKISETAGRAWDNIVGAIKGAINGILSAWNGLDVSVGPWTIPDWVPGLGGKTFHIADLFPDVPLLARGGIARTGGLSVVGERGPELVNMPAGASVIPLPPGMKNLGQAAETLGAGGRIAGTLTLTPDGQAYIEGVVVGALADGELVDRSLTRAITRAAVR